ncbi:MAG: aldose epimerase family protein [Pseudomonadota bacterium]
MEWVEIESGALRARVAARGAALVGLWHRDWPHSVVLGTADPAVFLAAHPYGGAVVGPVANRIGGARVSIAGQPYDLPANEGRTSLHSGPEGLHARTWDLRVEDAAVLARHTLPDGACGLPGRRQITARFEVADETLTVTLSAVSDRATLMNLALHPYFSLDGSGHLRDHLVRVGGAQYLRTDGAGLPTGVRAPVRDLGLGDAPAPVAPGLDHNICLEAGPAVYLEAARGPRVSVRTDAPALQVYAGAHLPKVPGSHGAPIGPGAGIALEPQMWPDAPSHPDFPSIFLHAGKVWSQTTTYCLKM